MFFRRATSRTKDGKSVLLVEFSVHFVAAMLTWYPRNGLPVIVYAKRLPIIAHESESPEDALFRTFSLLGEALVREGAPALTRTTGNGSADLFALAFDTPWEATALHTGKIERSKPFTVTRALVAGAVADMPVTPSDKLLVDRSVVGTILNDYEVRDPFGKEARRAFVITLESLVDARVVRKADEALSHLYHRDASRFLHIAATNARYEAIRALFPLERNFIIVDTTASTMRLVLQRNGLLVGMVERTGVTESSWGTTVLDGCAELAKSFPLPHAVFLVTREKTDAYKARIARLDFSSLWLSDEAPTIIPLAPSHITNRVVNAASTTDVPLLLLALYFGRLPAMHAER